MVHERFLAQSYWQFLADQELTKGKTSKTQMPKAKIQRLNDELNAILASPAPALSPDLLQLQNTLIEHLVPQWQMQLKLSFSLVLYGYGSKSCLLKEIARVSFSDHHLFHWQPWKNISVISEGFSLFLYDVCKYVNVDCSSRKLEGLAKALSLMESNEPLLIVLEQVESLFLNHEIKAAILTLKSNPNVRLIMTMEHVNALTVLSQRDIIDGLNIVWHDATTMVPYHEELRPLMAKTQIRETEDTRILGAEFVLNSLTQTARRVFSVLAEAQLRDNKAADGGESSSDSSSSEGEDEADDQLTENWGLPVGTWYQRCQEQFLVSNEMAFRTQLIEFVDHDIVRSCGNRGQNGTDFYIPFERSALIQLISLCTSKDHIA